ncbi:MAG TPA: site-2 protease family protein [Candidatus Paceibacterota bacterium]|nr:site-2 protease family protein [Candidatus Paceibacterota bacterium]
MSVIIFLIVLAVLIITHEFGHFIVAKKSGIRVDEFGLGFPPKLFGWKKGETVYSLNALPFGGFVKIHGENPDEESIAGSDSDRSMANKPRLVQAAVLAAGVTFNILLAWLLISVGFMYGLPTSAGQAPAGTALENVRLMITSVAPESPAETAGIKAGDIVVAYGEKKGAETVYAESVDIPSIQEYLAAKEGKQVVIKYLRGQENPRAPASNIHETTVVPAPGIVEGRPAVGISMDMVGTLRLPWWKALVSGAEFTAQLIIATVVGLKDFFMSLFTDGKEALSSVTGPIGLVGLVGDASELGLAYLLSFTAFISINLAVLNMVPFPALDGGRLLFLAIEGIKGSRLNPKIANAFNLVGFALLILLMITITISDIGRLF